MQSDSQWGFPIALWETATLHHLVVSGVLNGLKEAALREAGVLGSHIVVTGLGDQHAHFTYQLAQLPAGTAGTAGTQVKLEQQRDGR